MTFKPPTMQQAKEIFNIARRAYPGVKRGNDTEYEGFCKKHKDWKKAVSLLLPAIKEQIKRRDIDAYANRFVPPWKHFKTWLYNRCWEETVGVEETPEEKAANSQRKLEKKEKEKEQERQEYQRYFEEKSTQALEDMKKDEGGFVLLHRWLIDEVLAKRK